MSLQCSITETMFTRVNSYLPSGYTIRFMPPLISFWHEMLEKALPWSKIYMHTVLCIKYRHFIQICGSFDPSRMAWFKHRRYVKCFSSSFTETSIIQDINLSSISQWLFSLNQHNWLSQPTGKCINPSHLPPTHSCLSIPRIQLHRPLLSSISHVSHHRPHVWWVIDECFSIRRLDITVRQQSMDT